MNLFWWNFKHPKSLKFMKKRSLDGIRVNFLKYFYCRILHSLICNFLEKISVCQMKIYSTIYGNVIFLSYWFLYFFVLVELALIINVIKERSSFMVFTAVIRLSVCLSVCPSVRPSVSHFIHERFDVSSWNLVYMFRTPWLH